MISTGILPSGFVFRRESFGSVVSARSMVTSLSKPNSAIAMRTLRTKGEDGEKRKIIMASPSLQVHRRKVESTAPQVGTRQRDENWRPLVRAGVETRRLARDDQVDRLRTF